MRLLKFKRYIRDHEKIINIFSMLYNVPFKVKHIFKNRNNKIIYVGSFLKKTKISFEGKENRVIIEKACRLKNCTIKVFGNNNIIHIKNDCEITGMNIWCADGSSINIDSHTHFVNRIHLAATEGKRINIGEKCLFAEGVIIRTGDSHSIVSASDMRLNYAKDVEIGNHV